MTRDQIKTQTLTDLHGGYELLRGSTPEAAALLIAMHLASLLVMRNAHYLDGFELAEEIIQLYYVVEAEHPGQWLELGGPPIPDERKV